MRLRMHFLAAVVFLILMGFTVALAAGAYSRALERRDTHTYISDALADLPPPSQTVTWGDPVRPLVRPFTPADAERVGIAMSSAWRAHAAAMATGATEILADYFSGVALARAVLSAERAVEQRTQMVLLEHNARPTFYHLDGSVLQAEADILAARFALADDGGLAAFELSRDRTLTTFMNETTGWRVFSHERLNSTPVERAGAMRPLSRLAGVNYYPAKTPWRAFWPEFDPEIVAADFALIAGLGANAVRVFLPRDAFLSRATAPRSLSDLAQLLGLAEAAGLSVIPTLFDLKSGYAPADWPDDARLLRAVMPVLRESPAVALIDLKNEPDLDYAAHGEGLVRAWVKTMAALARREAPGIPLTVGWSSAAAAEALIEELDAISYHDYAPPAETAARLARLRAKASGRPVLVTEIGASAWSLFLGIPGSEAEQAEALRARIAALDEADGILIWTLHDFPDPDPRAVGRSPWVRGIQSGFGLYAGSGQPKPAAAEVRRSFAVFLAGPATE